MEFINRVNIKEFMDKGNLVWTLKPDVNILSGINGSGKTTLLYDIYNRFVGRELSRLFGKNYYPIYVDLEKSRIDSVSDFQNIKFLDFADSRISDTEQARKLIAAHPYLKTQTDILLYDLLEKYAKYHLRLAKKVDKKRGASYPIFAEHYGEVYAKYYLFIEAINKAFEATQKVVSENTDSIFSFDCNGSELSVYQLSKGEKNYLVMLLTALLFDSETSVLLINRPELSLHIDLQKSLVKLLREIAPNTQLIIATHAPAIIYDDKGWVVNIEDLITKNQA